MNEWLDGAFGNVRCANCGAVYGHDRAIQADGDERILMDDVLEAHEMLRDYVGDVHALFEKVSGR
ncbi:MAG: hypothetical protein ABI888_01095 [Chloroflexota bacterium]